MGLGLGESTRAGWPREHVQVGMQTNLRRAAWANAALGLGCSHPPPRCINKTCIRQYPQGSRPTRCPPPAPPASAAARWAAARG